MNVANAQIGDWLGLRSPATEGEILRIVEGRLAPSVIKRLGALGLERTEIDAVVIPSRTLQHRRSRREKLTVEESDRVLRLIRVLSLTESVYGCRERALAWLRRPHPRLDGRTPLSLLKTGAGSRIVEELLIQIDEGMFIQMVLWRISRHRDLSGIGGLKAAGRWHHPGHTIVYMTETPASSLLEVCVHTSANDVPPAFALLKIEGPDIEVPSIKADDLPKNWRAQLEATRDLGTAWLEKNESMLLRVPSVIVPETVNFLFNPSHKLAAKFRITDVFPYPFDLRLKK